MSFRISKISFYAWLSSPRMLALLILITGLLLKDFLPLRAACKGLGYRVSIGFFPLYLGSTLHKQFLLCITLLFADAPFLSHLSPYEQIRTSRHQYFFAKLIYIVVSVLLFVFFIFIISQLILFPYLAYIDDWGKVLSTLASTRLYAQYPVSWMAYQEVVLNRLSVGQAFLASTAMTFVQGFFLASIMLLIALATPRSKNAHNLFAMAYIFVPDIVKAFGSTGDLKYLPSSWMRLSILNLNRSSGAATLGISTALMILGAIALAACIGSYFLWQRTDPYQYLKETR